MKPISTTKPENRFLENIQTLTTELACARSEITQTINTAIETATTSIINQYQDQGQGNVETKQETMGRVD